MMSSPLLKRGRRQRCWRSWAHTFASRRGDGFYEIAKILVSRGADGTAKNEFGQTAIDLARDRTIEVLESAKQARS